MNKPAAKEPTMDEILSSIRQIIADEDQEGRDAKGQGLAEASAPATEPDPDEAMLAEDEDVASGSGSAEDEPLALSAEQMVSDEPEPKADDEELGGLMGALGDLEAQMAPDAGDEVETVDLPEPVLADTRLTDDAEVGDGAGDDAEDEPGMVLADDVAFGLDEVEPAREPRADPSAMPDPDLSSDIAERLLEPTAAAATKQAFTRLNKLSMGSGDVTIEKMVREMLRPMLKEWLDENLPSVVEKMVEQEIERISRGS